MWNLLDSNNPFSELRKLQKEMNNLFNGYGYTNESYPAVNIYGNDEELVVLAELPGVSKEDISLTVQFDNLTIEGKRKVEGKEGTVYHRRERGNGKFIRTFRLPYEVENDKVTAKYQNGVLEIKLPRAETAKPRKITVNG